MRLLFTQPSTATRFRNACAAFLLTVGTLYLLACMVAAASFVLIITTPEPMTDYQAYGEDYHVQLRTCQTLNRPASECRCDECEAVRVRQYEASGQGAGDTE